MAFNNFPYTNFQDLNLGWILAKIKEALTRVVAVEARADSVEADVATYSDRIDHAIGEADSARDIANLARQEAGNAQSDATSGIAIGQAAQAAANAAAQTANGAVDTANSAYSLANDANYAATVAGNKADSAVEDYLQVNINIYPSHPATSDKNVDQILTAVTANKKIKFTLDDARNGETHTTYDYTIDPVDNTASDIDIQVYFDTSASSNSLKFLNVTFSKRVGTGGLTTYSTISRDVTFSGGDSQLTSTLLNLLIPILRQGLYGTDQQAAISALETALGGTPPVQTYVITNNLTNVTNSNEATAVNSGTAYTATLTPAEGMEMQTVTVTMGGVDVTSTVYSNGTISIASVTGNIVITAVAESVIETYTPSLSEGYVNPTNGSVGGTSTYKHTEVIPVREGDKVYGHSVDSSTSQTVNGIATRFTATYDSNDTIYASGGSSTETVYKEANPFVVPSGVYGVVFSITNRYANDVVVYVDKSERVGA